MKRPVWLDRDFFEGLAFVIAIILGILIFGTDGYPLW